MASSLLFLWLAFRKVDPGELLEVMAGADLGPLLVAVALSFSMIFVRGLRWFFFLKPITRIPVADLGWSVAIGFAVNNLIGVRLGEVARSLSAGRKGGLAASTVLGTVVVERVWDAVSLLALFLLGLWLGDFSRPFEDLAVAIESGLGVRIDATTVPVSLTVAVAVILVGVVVLRWRGEAIAASLDRLLGPVPQRWREMLTGGLRGFARGLTQTTDPFEVAVVTLLSVVLWIAAGVGVWLCLGACHIEAGMVDAAFVLMALALAVAIPSGPGYIGTYHFLAASAISLSTGAPLSQATAAAIVLHLSNYLPRTLAGGGALLREGWAVFELSPSKER